MKTSFTTANGNTVYLAAGKAAGPHRAGAAAGWAVDVGSDGTLDAGRGRAVGVGPNGAAAVHAGFGPNGHGARAIATNGETTRTWSRFVHS
ncbi:MAG: hypothetical protein AB7S38_15455 [Vulcanimicrobiota bacterium]